MVSLRALSLLPRLATVMTTCNQLPRETEVWIVQDRAAVVRWGATVAAVSRVRAALLAWLLVARHYNALLNRDARMLVVRHVWASRSAPEWFQMDN